MNKKEHTLSPVCKEANTPTVSTKSLPCWIPKGSSIHATDCHLWITWPGGPDLVLSPGTSFRSIHKHTCAQYIPRDGTMD